MVNSPVDSEVGVVTFEVTSDASTIPSTYALKSIYIQQALNRIPLANLIFLDGSPSTQDFPIADSDNFKPGKKIVVKVGYDSKNEDLFTGIVVSTRVVIDEFSGSKFEVQLKDESIKMTVGRKNAIYEKKADSDIIKTLIGNSSLTAKVTATTYKNPTLVQHYCTDWDFMLSRAELNGLVVNVDAGTVNVVKPGFSEEAVLKVTYGFDMLQFDGELNAVSQFKQVKGASWDMSQQKVAESTSSNPSVNEQGNLTSTTLADVVGLSDVNLQSGAGIPTDVLKSWADAQMQKSWMNKVTGIIVFQGSEKAKAGSIIELAGVGERLNGKAFISKVEHEISDGNWKTTAEMGMPEEWYAEKSDIVAPSASGLLPGINGLTIGTVSKLDGDPDTEFRIQVKLPMIDSSSNGIWARLGTFAGNSGTGSIFIPSVGDEVVVGFVNDDPGYPIVLGALYSSKNKPAADLEGNDFSMTSDNYRRAIVTPVKNRIEFDDEKKIITIATPGGNKCTIDDDAKGVTVEDQNSNKVVLNEDGITLQDKSGNKIVMSSDGITLDSAKDVVLKAAQNIKQTATSNINVEATQNVEVKGLQISQTANTSFTAKGNASAELSASGNTTIKGAMVMIN